MAVFFIDTVTGQIATSRQLADAGCSDAVTGPPAPWHRIQGTSDAQTLWYAVMRKKTRGIFIGTLTVRHQPHHASLLQQGWEEVSVGEIRAPAARPPD